ncbi:MAG TPA: D-glycero-beta-D-manno-heptose-7-phosphate kinase [Paenalcaligenes sp.]|nr:D-glycero-beta-D-manno-heptose-7-phosphate kinase [Paenalcaligenes sp.]
MRPFPNQEAQKVKVLIIGDVMLDRYWFGKVERISPEAPVPVVHVVRTEDRLGGAANVARNVVALGAQATLIGLIGDDQDGQITRKLLHSEGISEEMIADPMRPTTLKLRVIGRQQQLMRVDFEEDPSQAALGNVQQRMKDTLKEHDIVVLSDYAKGALKEVQQLIQIARQEGIPILVDPKGDDYQRYQGANLLTPNLDEVREAVGRWHSEDELEERAQKLRKNLQLDALLITRSEQGMTIYTPEACHHVEAQAKEVFDVSGAGDTVLATLAVTKGAGLDWVDAMHWANRAGGIVVGKLGTSVVTAQELQ